MQTMKSGCQTKEYKVATWKCHIHNYNRDSHIYNYNRNSYVHNALQKIMCRKMWRKKQGSALRLLFIYLHQNLFIIKKHLALVLQKNCPCTFLYILN